MYEKQTQSKKYRGLDKTLGVYFRTDQLYEQLHKKHFKKQYAGKPTKKYLKLTQQIQRAESMPYHEMERLMLSWKVVNLANQIKLNILFILKLNKWKNIY